MKLFLFIDFQMQQCLSLMSLKIVLIIGFYLVLEVCISFYIHNILHHHGQVMKFILFYVLHFSFLNLWIYNAMLFWEISDQKDHLREAFQKDGDSIKYHVQTIFGKHFVGWHIQFRVNVLDHICLQLSLSFRCLIGQ